MYEPSSVARAFLGIHIPQRGPQSQGTVPDGKHGCGHPAAAQVAQQARPRLLRFAISVFQRDDFLRAVGAPTHYGQTGQAVFFEPYVEIHTVRPDIHVVRTGQRALAPGLVFILPYLRQSRYCRRRQTSRIRSQQHRQGFCKVASREATQVQHWQRLFSRDPAHAERGTGQPR